MQLLRLILTAAATLLLCGPVRAGQKTTPLRIGYLADPGSALVLLAAEQGQFRRERLSVTLVPYPDAAAGLAALASGKIRAGAFPLEQVLQAIAAGEPLQIVAGGGTPQPGELLAELDRISQDELRRREVVTVIRRTSKVLKNSGRSKIVKSSHPQQAPRRRSSATPHKAASEDGGEMAVFQRSEDKETAIRLVKALLLAYEELQRHEAASLQEISYRLKATTLPGGYAFNPNPDYYRLAAVWEELGLQRSGMRRDFLAGHVYEEIYCDALDRALDAEPSNAILKRLASVAVCTPDCCPDAKKRNNKTAKGVAP